MLSSRLLTIASLVEDKDSVLDIGTDHGYLPIYLYKNKLCKSIIASDISQSALENAKKNIGNLKIKLFLSDGLKDINDDYDTICISGMGTHNIINIIGDIKIKHIILSSNNNLYELRCYMKENGYKIEKEISVLDKNKYYDIISYKLGKDNLSKMQLMYGKSDNKDYYKYLYLREKEIFNKLKFIQKIKRLRRLLYLKNKTNN